MRSPRLTAILLAVTCLAAAQSPNAPVAPFGLEPLTLGEFPNGGWIAADLDLDGDLDLLGGASWIGGNREKLMLRNQREAGFLPTPEPFPEGFLGVFVPGDINGDGQVEVLGIPKPGGSFIREEDPLQLWQVDPHLRFTPAPYALTNAITLAEIANGDRDPVLDLLLWGSGQDSSERHAWLTHRASTSTWLPPGLPVPKNVGIGWGDFDADGDLDVVVSGWQSSPNTSTDTKFTRLYLNAYPNGFQPSDAGLPQDDLYRVAPFDFDQDGLLDLFLGPLAPVSRPPDFVGSPARLFRNTGQGSFVEVATSFPPFLSAVPAWGDFDQDGDPDLLLVSDASSPGFSPQLWRHDGPAGFTQIETGISLLQANEALWGDIDNDGDLDAVLAGLDASPQFGLFLARNRSARSNSPPQAPTHLAVLRTPAGALLTWNEATDPDQSTRLTYNLRVGRSPGAGDVIAPLADPVTGRRRTTGPGNVGPLLQRQLGDLPNGTYYWSVQSVDAGYAASALAPEQSFVVSRPSLSGLDNLAIPPNRPSGPFPFTIADAETPADQLKITFTSSNADLLPVSGISVTGTGTSRNLLLNPNPYRAGTTTVRATVEDAEGEQRSLTFSVTVQGELTPIATPLSDFVNLNAAWGDADLDGDLDLLLGGWNSEPVFGSSNDSSIFENRNGQIGTHRLSTLSPAVTEHLQWIDINRDGILDVFATILRGFQRSTYLFQGKTNASWTLENPQTGPLPVYTQSASAWADADNDGDLDLLQFGSETETKAGAQLQLSQGRFGFSPSRDHQPFPLHDAFVAWADIDGDGDHDYVVAGRFSPPSPGSVTLLFRNHQGRFADSPVSLPGITQGSVTFSDVDVDGDPDLLLTGTGPDGPLTRLFHNDGAGNFSEVPTDLPQLRDSTAAWADADGDGRPDLALCGRRQGSNDGDLVTGVWLNRAHGFVPAAMVVPGVVAGSLAWGDFDGDGAPDLVITGNTNTTLNSGRYTGVFHNEFHTPTPTPPTPVNLSSRIEGDDSIFQWSLPPGSPSGLTFNLRVGTAPGLDDVVQVPANPATGTLRIPQPGQAGGSGSWRLRRLPKRDYFWSVQSVDPAFRASAFSSENVLGVPNAPPTLGTIPPQDGPLNAPVGPISFTVADSDGDDSAVTLSASSSNPAVIDNSQISFSGTGGLRQVTLVPQPDAHGVATITVTARDALGATTQTSFTVSITWLTRVPLLALSFEPVSLAPADYDHDGDPDLLYGYFRQSATSAGQTLSGLHINDGTFFFTTNAFMSLPARDPRPSWGDVDADGDLDLFTASTLLRNEDGAFMAEAIDVDPDAPSAWGDYDADGDLDLAVVGGSKRWAQLFRNEGGKLTRIDVSWRPVGEGAVAWGDPDLDGDLDVALSGREIDALGSLPRLVIYRNDAGQFVEVFRDLGVTKGFLQWADINRDGRPDLLMAGQTPEGPRERIGIHLGGLRFLWNSITISPGSFSGYPGATLLDLDSDGDLDLAEFTASASFAVRANDGNGIFATNAMASANVSAGLLRAADFDRDGDFDLVVAGRRSNVAPGGGTTFLFRNQRPTTTPTASGLESTVIGNDVDLRWPSIPTWGPPASSSTYNLRVGTSPGAFDVVTPLVEPKSGRRQVPDHGNMGFARQTRLRGLPPGTYFWSVQPVDSSWIGGPFEAESTFTITEPLAATRFEQASTSKQGTLELSWVAPQGFLVIVESALQPQQTNWTQRTVRRIGAAGRDTLVVPSLREAEYFRLRALP